VANESQDPMAMSLQKVGLSGEGLIFAPRLLIKVMAEKDFQLINRLIMVRKLSFRRKPESSGLLDAPVSWNGAGFSSPA